MASIWPYTAPWWAWLLIFASFVPWLALGLCILARYIWRNPPFCREWESSKDLREISAATKIGDPDVSRSEQSRQEIERS